MIRSIVCPPPSDDIIWSSAASARRCSSTCRGSSGAVNLHAALAFVETSSGHLGALRVVIVLVGRLEQWQWQADAVTKVLERRHLASDNGADDESHEDDEHEEVKHRVADDSPLAKLRLLERVDGWTNLLAANIVSEENQECGAKGRT